jgi:hypothetical protein
MAIEGSVIGYHTTAIPLGGLSWGWFIRVFNGSSVAFEVGSIVDVTLLDTSGASIGLRSDGFFIIAPGEEGELPC